MKNWFAALIALVLSLTAIMAGCSGSQRGDGLILWWISGQQNEQIIREAVAAYSEQNPGTEIEIVSKAGMDVFQAYKIALSDDNTRPDVAILDHVYVQSLAKDGMIANLSAMGAGDVQDIYPTGLWQANLYEGNSYALPLSANTIALMYNENILKEAGVTDDGTPTGKVVPPTTLEELFDACEKVEEIGKTPFAQPINSFAAMAFMSYVGRLGGSIVSEDYRTVKLDGNAQVKEALEIWKKFSGEGWVNKNEFEEGKFYSGGVAFLEMGSWNISKVSGNTAVFDVGVTEMVRFDSEHTNVSGLGLYSLVVAEDSVDKQAAYALAKYLSSDEQFQLKFNQSQNLFPVTKTALANEHYTEDAILSVYAAQMEKVTPRPGTPVWPDLEQVLVTMLRSAVLNGDVDGALATAQRNAQAATDRIYGAA